MQEIALSNIPNQSLSVRLEDAQYDITLKACDGVMGVTIVRDNEVLISNVRAVCGVGLLPYRYLEEGNFFIDTLDDELPDYTKFGISQSLIYVTQAELAAIRAGA